MNYPNAPIQTSLEMQWHRRMAQAGRANRIRPSRGLKVRRTPNGIFLQASGGGGRVELALYRFKSMEDDWLVCRTWDGKNEGSKDVLIAKPTKLQFSIESETIDGVEVDYSAYDTEKQMRHASSGVDPNKTEEDQVIVPRYLMDDLIYVMPARTLVLDADEKDLGLLDMNVDGRAWAATS
jgi:hypothetical protein